MTKPPVSLDLVRVASPCPASWDGMAGDQRVRFCKQCSLHVYNLSDMSREEAEQFVNQAEGRTCIRLFRRQDGTVLTRDCPVGLRAVRERLVRAVAALAGLILAMLSGTLFASRLKNLSRPGIGRPATAYSEWIQPGSTEPVVLLMGDICVLPPTPLVSQTEAQESPLPEPTAEQLQEISERLAK